MDQADATATARFKAPVDKSYQLLFTFRFADDDTMRRNVTIGNRHNTYCDGRPYAQVPSFARDCLGRPMPLRIVVRASRGGTVVAERTLESLCISSHGDPLRKTRHLTIIALQQGEYIAEVTKLAAQPELAGVRAELMLAGGTGQVAFRQARRDTERAASTRPTSNVGLYSVVGETILDARSC
ncbi:DUF5625 family protein [Pseudoduganella sp. SL102]|uniref:DUF5625 family protein n=1 Tax=Pseudoduganella sp. SL102 TaxID=2995154 RepID=UPI00248B8E8B|nr:DUF5625 family protein [Pseudoduganella sp. SL102]WBS04597.1 DUF5625 family protein [Pseudoduganella sp. SL102]